MDAHYATMAKSLRFMSPLEQNMKSLNGTSKEEWISFATTFQSYVREGGLKQLHSLFHPDVLYTYSELLRLSNGRIEKLSNDNLIQRIVQYHRIDSIYTFQSSFKAIAMKEHQCTEKDHHDYLKSFITILSKNSSLIDPTKGGGTTKQLVAIFISGVQPSPFQTLLKDKDSRSLPDLYEHFHDILLLADIT
eukprot:gene1651-2318_t